MLFQGPGEDVTAGSIGDEIQLVCFRRVQYRLDRSQAGVANGSRRQGCDGVGVVGILLFQIRPGQRTAQRSFTFAKAIDNGRVRLQTHTFTQSIYENPGDSGPFSLDAGFLLDNGSQDERIERAFEWKSFCPLIPQGSERLIHGFDHAFNNISPAVAV